MNLQDENKKLKEKLQELEWIKDFQQDVIVEFEKVTGKELSKKLLPKHLANEIQKKKKKLKQSFCIKCLGYLNKLITNELKPPKTDKIFKKK